jgi:hypothetical protein
MSTFNYHCVKNSCIVLSPTICDYRFLLKIIALLLIWLLSMQKLQPCSLWFQISSFNECRHASCCRLVVYYSGVTMHNCNFVYDSFNNTTSVSSVNVNSALQTTRWLPTDIPKLCFTLSSLKFYYITPALCSKVPGFKSRPGDGHPAEVFMARQITGQYIKLGCRPLFLYSFRLIIR